MPLYNEDEDKKQISFKNGLIDFKVVCFIVKFDST